MGAMIDRILGGERDKMKILSFDTLLSADGQKLYQELCNKYIHTENGRIESIKKIEYKDYGFEKVEGNGYCVLTLEAALWAFLTTNDFKSGLKRVVSLGDDTDTTGAVYGQIAGAYYGIKNVPWVQDIAWIDKITKLAEQIYEANSLGNTK